MAELIEVIEPKEKEFLVRLTQSEVDFIQGIMSDFLDNPIRKVRMVYCIDENQNYPNPHGKAVVRSIFSALKDIDMADDYDYFRYWEEEKIGEPDAEN